VIVPVKRLELAKSRLRGTLPGVDHDALVVAMAMDTLAAALASPAVSRALVVSGDPDIAAAAVGIGAEVIADVPDAGLNPALAYAAAHVRRRSVTATPPGVVALTGDLPALRTDELTAALHAASAIRRSFVTDTAGTGTVLLAAPPGLQLEPSFGGASAATHAASGAVDLGLAWPTLRRDVDTAADLAAAVRLGVGPRTAAAAGAPQTVVG